MQLLVLSSALVLASSHCHFRGTFSFPYNYTFTYNNGSNIGTVYELSSLTFSPKGSLHAISDRGNLFDVSYSFENGMLNSDSLKFESVLELQNKDNVDTEGLVVLENGDFFVSTEKSDIANANVLAFSRNGTNKGPVVTIPAFYVSNTRTNHGFEALTAIRNGTVIITATEKRLKGDHGFVRLLQFDIPSNQLVTSLKYEIEENWGLVELIALDDDGLLSGNFLALERSHVNMKREARIFYVQTKGASNLQECMVCSHAHPVKKSRICDLREFGIHVSNYEAMAIVPPVSGATKNSDKFFVLLVNDDNFEPKRTGTQFVLAAVDVSKFRETKHEEFPWSDLNVLMTTDLHSWLSGHLKSDEPELTANAGDVLSLIEHIKSNLAAQNKDLFVVDNGDILHGTGLSDATAVKGDALFPLLMDLPFDAMTIGNHELMNRSSLEHMAAPDGLIRHFNGYLTSNVQWTATGLPVGRRWTKLVGTHSKVNVVAFGFLYDSAETTDAVTVTKIENAVEEEWFATALNQNVSAAIVLAHMDVNDELTWTILNKIREQKGDRFPVMFVTGHSHYRGVTQMDKFAVSLEAGRYLDTIGLASIRFGSSEILDVSHRFVDANVNDFRDIVGVSKEEFETENGRNLKQKIQTTRNTLQLDHVIGCSSERFRLGKPLWELYSRTVVPKSLKFEKSTILLMRSNALQYDLLEGPVTRGDIFSIVPFPDSFRVIDHVQGSIIRESLDELGPAFGISMDSEMIEDSVVYSVVTQKSDENLIIPVFTKVSGDTTVTWNVNDHSRTLTTHSVWNKYISKHMKCDGSSGGDDGIVINGDDDKDDSTSDREFAMFIGIGCIVAIGMGTCLVLKSRKPKAQLFDGFEPS